MAEVRRVAECTTPESPGGDDSDASQVSRQGESASPLASLVVVSHWSVSVSACLTSPGMVFPRLTPPSSSFRHLLTGRLDFRRPPQRSDEPPTSSWALSAAPNYPQCLSQSGKTSPPHLPIVLPPGLQHPGGGQAGEAGVSYQLLFDSRKKEAVPRFQGTFEGTFGGSRSAGMCSGERGCGELPGRFGPPGWAALCCGLSLGLRPFWNCGHDPNSWSVWKYCQRDNDASVVVGLLSKPFLLCPPPKKNRFSLLLSYKKNVSCL